MLAYYSYHYFYYYSIFNTLLYDYYLHTPQYIKTHYYALTSHTAERKIKSCVLSLLFFPVKSY